MTTTYRARHTTIDDDLKDHAEARLQKLDRWLHRIDSTAVVVAYEPTRSAADQFSVEVTVHSGGLILRGEERGPDARTALDAAADAVARQAQRHRSRLTASHRRGRQKDVAEPAPALPTAGNDGALEEYIAGKVVRTKTFEAKPMSHEEALAQMDLLGHDFFLFQDAATGEYALLYKRKDGGYGLLTPSRF